MPPETPLSAPAVLADPAVLVPDTPLDAPVAASAEPFSPGSRPSIAATVEASEGRIQTCLGQALKKTPTLSGRVSAGWSIEAGRVTESHLVTNTTGDDDLGVCVVAAAHTFRFDPSITANVREYPWIIAPR